MRNYFKLTFFLLKCGLGSAEGKKKKKGGNMGSKAMTLLVVVCVLPLMGMMYAVGIEGYKLFQPLGMEQLVIQLVCIAGAMVIFFLGMSMVISVFYMTSDIQELLPLPLTPAQIVAAKGTVALLYEYLWVAFFVAPVLVGYGVASHGGALYWICAVIGCLVLPVVPLVYAGILSMLVMRVFKGIRNKDFLSIMGFAVTLLLAFGISMGSQFMQGTGGGDILSLVQDKSGIINAVGAVFPNFRFLSGAIAQESLLQLLLFIATSAVFVVIFLLAAKVLYLPGVLGMSESSDKKRVLSKEEKVKASRPKKQVYSYLTMEWKKLVRTPVYFYNCVLMCIIWPLIVIVPVFISLAGSGIAFGAIFRSSKMTAVIREFLQSDASFGVVIMAVGCISMFVASMNETTGTSISREGSNYYIMKYIPMSYRDQIKAKIGSGSIISFLGSAFYVIICESALVFLGMNFFILPLSLLLNVLCILLLNYIQMLFDLVYPKLVWETEAAAVKQNFHASIGVFIGVGIALLLGGGGFWLYSSSGVTSYILVPVLILVLGVITFVLRKMTYAYGEKRLAELED